MIFIYTDLQWLLNFNIHFKIYCKMNASLLLPISHLVVLHYLHNSIGNVTYPVLIVILMHEHILYQRNNLGASEQVTAEFCHCCHCCKLNIAGFCF